MISKARTQQGMALFQVLLIVAIISVLLLIMSASTKGHVERAQQLQEQTEQQLALHSAANYTDFVMLTNDWADMLNQEQPIPLMNFHNYKSRLPLPQRPAYAPLHYSVDVQFQNMASLIGINRADEDLKELLIFVGVPALEATAMIAELKSWLYREDRVYLQHVNELNNVPGWSSWVIDALRPYVTAKILPLSGAWAPDELLPILLTSGQADTIIALRQSNQYSPSIYEEFSGQETGFGVSLYPGEEQRVTVTSPLTGEQLRRGVIYATHDKNPRTIEYKRYLHEQQSTVNESIETEAAELP